jgi:hypothetical protein
VDEAIDLSNLSTDMQVGGYFPVPLLKESKFTMYDLLDSYHPDVPDMRIDTTREGDIFLAYERTFSYEMPNLNEYFGAFDVGMHDLSISSLFKDNSLPDLLDIQPQTLPSNFSYEKSITESYDLNKGLDVNNLANKQRITRILFQNTDIEITLNPSFNIRNSGVLKLQIQLQGDPNPLPEINVSNGPQSYTFHYDELTINANGNIGIKFIIKGDGETVVGTNDKIDCEIKFKKSNENFRYVVYGFFNYSLIDLSTGVKLDNYITDIRHYIPEGSVLNLEDPKFEFSTESNIGATLQFKLDKIESFLDDNGRESIKTFAPSRDPFSVYRANTLGETTITNDFEPINRDFFKKYGNANISDYITVHLDSLGFTYQLSSVQIPDLNNPTIPEEFIASDSKLDIHGKLTVPLAFDYGSVLCYSDTVEVDFTEDALDDVSLVELYFTCTNHLPLGLYVDFYLLDKNRNLIPGGPYQRMVVEKPEVYAEGAQKGRVKNEKVSEFKVAFNKNTNTSITKLKEAGYILLKYTSEDNPNKPAQDVKPTKLTTSDYVKVKIGMVIDGKITISDK